LEDDVMMKTRALWFYLISLAGLCCAAPARADMFGFQLVPVSPSHTDGSVAAQLSLEVTDASPYVLFTLRNNLAPGSVLADPLQSSVTQVYFDDRAGTLDSLVLDFPSSPGVYFASEQGPPNLPSGNNLTPAFDTDFWVGATPGAGGVAGRGVNPGEFVQIKFNPGTSYAGFLAALYRGAGDPTDEEGTLRVGIHVQQLIDPAGAQTSDAFVLTPPVVPAPAAAILGMLGLSVAGWRLRRYA
jgi:hypothetical protein